MTMFEYLTDIGQVIQFQAIGPGLYHILQDHSRIPADMQGIT